MSLEVVFCSDHDDVDAIALCVTGGGCCSGHDDVDDIGRIFVCHW